MLTTPKKITIETTVNASVDKVWRFWTEPKHIVQWCYASEDCHAPKAENDLHTGGKFSTTMAAKDGSMTFDFSGAYTHVVPNNFIAYTTDDNRKVEITFSAQADRTHISQTFEMESEHSEQLQRDGWQAILANFKNYSEHH